MRLRIGSLVIVLVLGLVLSLPVQAQGGVGVLVEGNRIGSEAIGPLNPLLCRNAACQRIVDLLYPRLVGIDPATGTFSPVSSGLVRDWALSADGSVVTFNLKYDRYWSDGTPITAYDVFYTYMAAASEDLASPYRERLQLVLRAVVPVDELTLAVVVQPSYAGCAAVDALNIRVVPAHVFDPDFAAKTAAAFGEDEDLVAWYESWLAGLPERAFAGIWDHPFNARPDVTAGVFQFESYQPRDYIRLLSTDGELGFDFIDVPSTQTQVAWFLAGKLNFIENPPYQYWDDILAAEAVLAYTYPGSYGDFIRLNLADPDNPQDAYDETGQVIEQGHHPIFGDPQVRLAIQKAINVEELIAVAFNGYGTILPANLLASSWAYDETLPPITYDPLLAAQLLEDAGWKDTDNNGVRECITCQYAEPDASLTFELLYDVSDGGYRDVVAGLIQGQLEKVGFNVRLRRLEAGLPNAVLEQRFDAYLGGLITGYPGNPDQLLLFGSEYDRVGEAGNVVSYFNPQVEELLMAARQVDSCDFNQRRELYQAAQTILQADQPYIWLYSPDELVAARNTVTGFDPYPHRSFWNVDNWVILR